MASRATSKTHNVSFIASIAFITDHDYPKNRVDTNNTRHSLLGDGADLLVCAPAAEQEQIRALDRVLQLGAPTLIGAHGQEPIPLPETVYRLLKEIVHDLQRGHALRLLPETQLLTTQQAADLLGVSRPHLIKLLTAGDLPYHLVGSHRRVYLQDVLAYARQRDTARHAALNALAREAFATGLYDGPGIPEGGSDE